MIRSVLFAVAIASAVPAMASPARVNDPVAVVDAFAAAQQSFDQAALAELTAPDFVEISPLGEVDPRDKMLGFYAPEKKAAGPAVTMDERTVRTTGNVAIVTLRYAFGERAMRAVYVVRRDAGVWRLVSAQYTPIRIVKPA
ncbi:MAG: nuclear transport factor 2 family protein [Sphingomonas sp.]|uniref:nuclear transport factor 2 family protein n=1 Tax=Sphingomonas sp. TaxID=28214 RepID=UPI001AC9D363|nr:nuclear transport factor 2 family protein [Sphingomonas sp.]MBN8816890.1 nuclear transport factor 2 family protein [Sphingomonas sp.]